MSQPTTSAVKMSLAGAVLRCLGVPLMMWLRLSHIRPLHCLTAPKGKRGALASASHLYEPDSRPTTCQHLRACASQVREVLYGTVLQSTTACARPRMVNALFSIIDSMAYSRHGPHLMTGLGSLLSCGDDCWGVSLLHHTRGLCHCWDEVARLSLLH